MYYYFILPVSGIVPKWFKYHLGMVATMYLYPYIVYFLRGQPFVCLYCLSPRNILMGLSSECMVLVQVAGLPLFLFLWGFHSKA